MRTTQNTAPLLVQAEIHDLLIDPVMNMSVAAQVAESLIITTSNIRFPVVNRDPTAAWVAEGEEIPVSDGEIAEVEANPTKLAGLTIITNELADDSNPQAAQVVGEGLARDIARKIDAAFFGPTSSNPHAQPGLAALAGVSEVKVKALDNLDAFFSARSLAEMNNSTVGYFVANPADALKLDMLKVGTASNAPLLAPDATAPNVRMLGGTPLLVSPAVPAGTVWGVPTSGAYVVARGLDATIDIDRSAFFTSDRCAVRAKLRVGFAFTNPGAVTKITVTA